MNLNYLCTNISSLLGVPVRLYKERKLCCFHSMVHLPLDPLEPYLEELFSISDKVGYFIAPHEYYYGIVRFDDHRIIIGPTRQMSVAEQSLHEIAFECGVHKGELSDFIKGMKSIMQMPLMSLLQLLALLNHILNDGEMLSLSDISIHELDQETLKKEFESAAAERVFEEAEENNQSKDLHNTMDVEHYLMDAIRRGDRAELRKFFSNVPALRAGTIAEDDIRQAKNTVIVTAPLASRAAMQGGMDAEEALSLSDGYIRKCERMHAMESIINLNYRLVMDYAERMEQLLYGHPHSALVIEVNNYVRQHLSAPITVGRLARHLCRGRSRLSTDFKKETGEALSVFILKQKIEEGKRLLAYSDKAIIDIALYLGFSSQSHFSRLFKRYTGMSPNEHRLHIKNSKVRSALS